MPTQSITAPTSTASRQLNRIPLATYRLQLRHGFGFDQIRELLPYLKSLGISDLYLSPLFRARAGSTHGYDVVDHTQVEPAFGGDEAFTRMAEDARGHGMGVLLDVVPNHMGINDAGNHYWLDVLENGEAGRFADFFDVDWDALPRNLKHRVLQPVLGKPFGATLEDGELKVVYQDHRLQMAYFDGRFPLSPHSWPMVLDVMLERLSQRPGANSGAAKIEQAELESIVTQLRHLPAYDRRTPETVHDRYREQRIARRRLGHLVDKRPAIHAALDQALVEINGTRGIPSSFDRLEELLNAQCYRLAYWRVASDEINYRRFFDINELAAIRVEDPRVFRRVHRLVADLIAKNFATGLRIDHPDGLLDPAQYFENLQRLYRESRSAEDEQAKELYVVAEKILSGDEQLERDWAVQGTTGYEFLNMVSRLLVDGDGVRQIRDDYEELAGVEDSAAQVLYESKKEAASVAMLSEMQMLAARLYRIAQRQRASRDYTQPALLKALQEIVASLGVYRTYVPPRGWQASEADHRRIGLAVRRAKRRNPSMSRTLFDFIGSVLLLQFPPTLDQDQREQWRDFALKLQQVSGPIAAKGVEDTAFYRYYPLASLNEVGGELDESALSAEDFHRLMRHRSVNWPHSMSASSTHDTKRSEDVRARLHVLSECPEAWKEQLLLWRQMNRRWLDDWDGVPVPHPNEEYLLYQTLVGTWPMEPMDDPQRETYIGRITQYMEKALREAKLNTSWMNPSEDYEEAVFKFIRKLLGPEAAAFQTDLAQFVAGIANAGFVNALSQVVLKATLPGVPDFYQGSELWDFSLVDPDNRRPVDYQVRQATLERLRASDDDHEAVARDVAAAWPDPAIKMLVTMQSLALRQQQPHVFNAGDYVPLATRGEAAEHVFAFARNYDDQWAITVVPRHFYRLRGRSRGDSSGRLPKTSWGYTDVVLPSEAGSNWRCTLSGRLLPCSSSDGSEEGPAIQASDLFEVLPVALLTSVKAPSPDE
jgi:(1->4)-alpha-D-glucan 1-alpha-D-glucosylmutase